MSGVMVSRWLSGELGIRDDVELVGDDTGVGDS